MGEQQFVGFLCSDSDVFEYYVRVINSIKRFKLKALWCPNAEKSIQVAAECEVPSVSHTAYQLMSRSDTKMIIIAGHPNHNIVFSLQARALKKDVVCIGCLATSIRSAQILDEFASRFSSSSFGIVYPLEYSGPLCLLRANINQVGLLQSVTAELCFRAKVDEKERLLYDAPTLLHVHGHSLISTIASFCKSLPERRAVTLHCTTSVVEHFRLRELQSAHTQITFGRVVASLRLTADTNDSLMIRIQGTNGCLQFDASELKLECGGAQSILWQGDGSLESIFRDGLTSALSADTPPSGPSELSLVQCLLA